jgi:iron complex outermembrane receptor protein
LKSKLRWIRGSLIVLFACVSTLQAQTTSSDDEERTIVIMDDIPFTETESALRYFGWTKEALEKHGANTPIEGLRNVPFFVGTTRTENDSLGGDGSASINLYGLGARNVATLINGRRTFVFSDINAIPLSGLARAEIIDGNVYGSDSVAGTVNFILLSGPYEKPYEGAEMRALYGNTTEFDAHVRQVYVRGAVSGLKGKVSIAAAGEYYSRASLFARDREISRTADLSNDATGLGLGGPNNNSPSFAGRISLAGLPSEGGGERVLIDLGENAPAPASYRAFDVPPGTDPSRFNSRAYGPAIPAMEKAMTFVTGRYKIFGDGLQLYGDLLYAKVKQDNAISPTPLAFTNNLNGLDEVRGSPFNPFPDNNVVSLRYRTLQELGLRESLYDRDFYRYVAGISGDIEIKNNKFLSRFGYDSGLVEERFDQLRTDSGDLTLAGIRNQIHLGNFDPFIGQSAPVGGIAPVYENGTQTGTQAYDNIAAARAASYVGHSSSLERAFLYDVKANAHLFPELWNNGIDVAASFERREINSRQTADPVQASGEALGFAALGPTRFREEVQSWFFEFGIPIVNSIMNVSGVRSLEVSLQWSREEFQATNLLPVTGSPVQRTASFTNENPHENFGGSVQLAVRYQPVSDLLLRASWRQSIRPPDFQELFSPIMQTSPAIIGESGIPPVPDDGNFVGGNPALTPETTDAYSAGIAWEPNYISGVTVTADFYQFFTSNVIVDSAYANAGTRFIQGLQLSTAYVIPTEYLGKFTLTGGWNHFFDWKGQIGPGNSAISFLGNYDNRTLPFAPGAIPWNKGFLSGEWEWRHFDFVITGNYIGDFRDDPTFDNVIRDYPRNVPGYVTLDMQLSYEWKKPPREWQTEEDGKNTLAQTESSRGSIWQRILSNSKVTVGVNNAFDRNPPTVLAALNDNYDTSLYSLRNRYYYIAFTKKF